MPAGDPASSESRRATDRLKQTRQARLHQRPRTEGRNRRPSTSAERRGLAAVGIQDARPRRGGGGGGGGGALKEATSPAEWVHRRSEEHTSELQSLMRISYAVFCLKKNRS